MDSKEILYQYIIGAMQPYSALAELEKNIGLTASLEELREAARARYVIGFIHRDLQFKSGRASEKDICLNIRDIVLILGKIRLTKKLYNVVRIYGAEFDLICENDYMVSCLLHIPEWLNPEEYINDVYAFREDNIELESSSAGDAILREHTVFHAYKSFEQKIAVHTALNLPKGYTLLVSQPTGGGKSLVTQLLASTTNGLTLVIVPTVALSMDQYQAAKNNLINNEHIYCYIGEQSKAEREDILKSLKESTARILFISPEAILKNSELRNILDETVINHYLVNIVIDEAHIVPDWGVFFRPDFQLFSILLKKWKHESDNFIRTYLLSATLSDDVVETLFSLFGTCGMNAQIRCDALRQEPRFYFCSVRSIHEQNQKVLEAIKLLPKPMVVYVLEPERARDIQKLLLDGGYLNIPVFTGEIKDDDRRIILKGWKNHDFDVVVATSAFGIGVDKPDVRTVIHACCPENLSRFYQEVGRGGRDHFPSISLFMPYQSQYDKESDVHRALGLVKTRVLTVEKAVARWIGMITHPAALIDADECILDTTATPSTMTDEEAEYAGNRNVTWNVNLLLFLHRAGFVDLLNVNYIYDSQSVPPKKYYSVSVKLLKPDVLADKEQLTQELLEPRQREYNSQMEGYRIISSLLSSPRNMCWGRVFRHLFPLSEEICNGCPADPNGRITTDETYKLRMNPEINLQPGSPCKRLARSMGSFDQLVVTRTLSGICTLEEIKLVAEKASENCIGVLVTPKRFENNITFNGIILNYEEFYFAIAHCPYLFANGVLCVLDNDTATNLILYKNLEKLTDFSYRKIIYCNDNTIVTSTGKGIREYHDGYMIPINRF